MHHDLETRLGPKADSARDLLRPLAFAHGAGLPWEDLWAPLASKLSGRGYTDEDLIWLRRQAGSYVVEAMESGHSVYRLYHAALAEYLRQGCDEAHIHKLFSEFLIGRVPTSHTGLDWSRAHPYTLAHLVTHAQRARMLDGLLLDPGFLVNAFPAGLLAALPAARSPDAERAARAYQRAVHQLRNQPEDHRFSYLEFASRITHADALASLITVSAPRRRWSIPWTHWPPEHPHRIMAGHLGQINGVACADPGDGNLVVASIGHDSTLRIWDLATAEPRGRYFVGTAPLVAIGSARLLEHRTVIVLLSSDGMLRTWDMSTATILRTVLVVPHWRRLASMRGRFDLVLRCLATSDGQQFAVVGGRGLPTSVWNLSSGQRAALLPQRAAPEAVEFTELIDGRTVLIVSLGGNERWVCDLQTGQKLPYEPPLLLPFRSLRSAYDRYIRGERVTYYALRGGPPVIAIRSSRRVATVIDLAGGQQLGTWDLGSPDVLVQLADSRTVSVPIPESKVSEALGQRRISESRQREVTAERVVPLGTTRGLDQVGREPGEPFSVHCALRGRFLQVELRDNLDGSGKGPISLTLAGHAADVTGYDWARMSDGGVVIVSAGRDGTIRRWDISEIAPGPGDESEQVSAALHRIVSVPLADGTPMGLTIADDTDVALWDLRSGKLVGKLQGRTAGVCAIGLERQPTDGPVAVTFDTDRTARIWNLPEGSQAGGFLADWMHWPSDAALARLPDGTRLAVTCGHGRKTIVWDLSSGRIRNVLGGHTGWSACVTCAEGHGRWPRVLTGGLDNRVNVWDLHSGRRRRRVRIVSWWMYLARPPAGRAHAVRTLAIAGGKPWVLVATTDGMARALRPRSLPWGARRTGAVPASSVETATLSNGRTVVVTATEDGMLRIWTAGAFTGERVDNAVLCEINMEVPVNDISIIDVDTLIIATTNGLTALRLDAGALEAGRGPDPRL
jgi:WD40 repeat protein